MFRRLILIRLIKRNSIYVFFFIYLVFLCSFSFGQFGFENWLHPNINFETSDIDREYIQFYILNDITYNDKETQIFQKISGIKLKKFHNNLDFKFDISNKKNRLKFTDDLFLLNYNQNFKTLKSSIIYHKRDNFQPTFDISINSKNQISYSYKTKILFSEQITVVFGFFNNKSFYNF